MAALTMASIEARIARNAAPALASGVTKRAAVAVVLRERAALEVLLIRRAERADDPWSGHVALPGGRFSEEDPSIEATAVREAREEVGLDLGAPGARRLGRLPDHAPLKRVTGLAITPVVFALRDDPALSLDPREVAATLWVPLETLRSGACDGRMLWWWRPVSWLPLPLPFVLPCWRYEGFTIWGLTHRMLSGLLALGDGA